MNSRRYPLVIPLMRKAISTDTFTVKTPKLRKGDTIILHHICCCNETSAGEVVTVGIKKGTTPVYIKTVTLTTAGYYYKVKLDVDLFSDTQVLIRVISPNAGDIYRFNVFGHIEVYSKE